MTGEGEDIFTRLGRMVRQRAVNLNGEEVTGRELTWRVVQHNIAFTNAYITILNDAIDAEDWAMVDVTLTNLHHAVCAAEGAYPGTEQFESTTEDDRTEAHEALIARFGELGFTEVSSLALQEAADELQKYALELKEANKDEIARETAKRLAKQIDAQGAMQVEDGFEDGRGNGGYL